MPIHILGIAIKLKANMTLQGLYLKSNYLQLRDFTGKFTCKLLARSWREVIYMRTEWYGACADSYLVS